jgi:hypothetical protein
MTVLEIVSLHSVSLLRWICDSRKPRHSSCQWHTLVSIQCLSWRHFECRTYGVIIKISEKGFRSQAKVYNKVGTPRGSPCRSEA